MFINFSDFDDLQNAHETKATLSSATIKSMLSHTDSDESARVALYALDGNIYFIIDTHDSFWFIATTDGDACEVIEFKEVKTYLEALQMLTDMSVTDYAC